MLAVAAIVAGLLALISLAGVGWNWRAGLSSGKVGLAPALLAEQLKGHVSRDGVDEQGQRLLERYMALGRAQVVAVAVTDGKVVWCSPPRTGWRYSLRGARGATLLTWTRAQSVPLSTQSGQAIGYLWVAGSPWSATPRLQWVALLALMAYWVLLASWVFVDARQRACGALAFGLFTLMTNLIGWATYLVLRPQHETRCARCSESVSDAVRFCPWCGEAQPTGRTKPRCSSDQGAALDAPHGGPQ
jgi:hypothetical protein